MKANNNNSFYSNYKIISNPLIVTVFPNNKSEYVIVDEKKVNRFMIHRVYLKSIPINLYKYILYFKDTSPATPLTKSTIAVTTETTTFIHVTTASAFSLAEAEAISSTYATTSTSTTNNNTYFIKLSGISQGDPMEGFPLYSEGRSKE